MVYIMSLDLESTGLSAYNNEIIEIAISIEQHHPGQPCRRLKSFQSYVKPTRTELTQTIVNLTNITHEMVANAPTLREMFDSLQTYLKQTCPDPEIRILTAYNGNSYDFPMLFTELCRVESNPEHYVRNLKLDFLVDTLVWCRRQIDPTILKRKKNGSCSYKLGDVYECCLQKPLVGAHGALADCNAVLDMLHTDKGDSFFSECCSDRLNQADASMEWMKESAYVSNPKSFLQSVLKRYRTQLDTTARSKSTNILQMFARGNKKRKRESASVSVA